MTSVMLEEPRSGWRNSEQGIDFVMSDIVKVLVYACLLFSPCIVAAGCASERRWFKRRNEKPYDGPERRDQR